MEKELQQLGLEEKEATLYLACLEKELNTPTILSKKTGLKRATIYFYLDKLEKKGLIVFEVRKARKYITAVAPKRSFKHYLETKKEEIIKSEGILSDIVTQLESLRSEDASRSRVYFYEGEAGVQFAITKILSSKKDIYWLGSIETLLSAMGERQLYRMLTRKRLKQETTSYAITDRRILKYPQFSKMEGNSRSFRFLDKDFSIPAVLGLFGNTICLFSKQKSGLKVVLIEDEVMFQMLHFLFQSLWRTLSQE